MTDIDAIIEAAARALFEVDETVISEYGLKLAARVVAAVTPLIEAAALERRDNEIRENSMAVLAATAPLIEANVLKRDAKEPERFKDDLPPNEDWPRWERHHQPLIRAATLEEAAQVADTAMEEACGMEVLRVVRELAADIRALKEQP